MGSRRCDPRRHLRLAPRKAQRIDPARLLYPNAVVAGKSRTNYSGYCFYALERMASYSADPGGFALVPRPAGFVFHPPFTVCPVLLLAVGAAVCGVILFQVLFNPVPVFAARLFYGIRLRPVVHCSLYQYHLAGSLAESALLGVRASSENIRRRLR